MPEADKYAVGPGSAESRARALRASAKESSDSVMWMLAEQMLLDRGAEEHPKMGE